MESASRSSGMPFPQDLRPKQKEIIEAYGHRNDLIAQLPTGYGKTKAAAGAYARLRDRGACNRMLCIVPRRGQAVQMANGLPDDLAEFGIKTEALIVGDHPAAALKAHSKNTIQVFIVTIQSLLAPGTWATVSQLMETGKWFVYFDEHHHYGSFEGGDGEWTNRIKSLSYSAMLAMSATAKRPGETNYFADPEIKETYRAAADDAYVKKLNLHAYEYTIDAVMVDGCVRQYTTESLAEEAGGDSPDKIDAHILTRKMRFSPKYISPLIMFPCDRMIDLRLQGVRSQMLVQAMSCAHAKCVLDQVRVALPDHLTADWVGTGPNGRTQEENDSVLQRFCPPKNKATGRRPWTLDVLVNVGMAGEGLDSMDVAEVVFLTSANATISNKQVIGRGARLMKVPDQPPCHINVDTGSPLAEFIGRDVEFIFDDDKPPKKTPDDDDTTKTRNESEYQELPETLTATIFDMRLTNIRGMPMFREVYETTRRKTDHLAQTDEEVAAIAEKAILDYLGRSNNAGSIYAQKSSQITEAVHKIAGLVFRLQSASGLRPDRTMIGDLCKRINSRKKRDLGAVPDADGEELDSHWQWLKGLERQILSQSGMGGVPQWLR